MIIQFIKDLPYDKDRGTGKRHIILRGLAFYGIMILLTTILLSILWLLSKTINIELPKGTNEFVKNLISSNGRLYALIYVGLLIPMIEELSFRLWLSFKKIFVCIGFAFLIFLLISIFQHGYRFCFYPKIIISVALFCALYFFTTQSDWDKYKSKYGAISIYLSVAVFGCMHMINFVPLDFQLTIFYLLLIMPPMLIGIVATYYRINLGFLYGWAFHALINTISFLFI